MRKSYDKTFKAKIGIVAIREDSTIQDIAQKYEVHPNLVSQWKKQLLENASDLFERTNKSNKKSKEEQREERLLMTIGELQVERDFLKKKYRQVYGREPDL